VCHFEIKAKGVKVVFKTSVIYLDQLIRKEDMLADKEGDVSEFNKPAYSYYHKFVGYSTR